MPEHGTSEPPDTRLVDGENESRITAARRWSPEEDDQLRHLIVCGWSVRRIAGVLNRSIHAIYWRVGRWGGMDALRHTTFAVRSASEVARLMAVPARDVKRWIERGWLRAHRNYARRSRRVARLRFLVSDEALEDFLADSQTWATWQVEAITDPDWRQFAAEARSQGQGAWIDTTAYAEREGIALRTAQVRIRRLAHMQHPEVQRFAGRWYIWWREQTRVPYHALVTGGTIAPMLTHTLA